LYLQGFFLRRSIEKGGRAKHAQDDGEGDGEGDGDGGSAVAGVPRA
jgi:hypothetical protein